MKNIMKNIVKFLACTSILLSVGIFFTENALAQTTRIITGVVRSDEGEPLRGAVMRLDGYTVGAVSDADGKLRIRSASLGNSVTAIVSMIGYESERVTIVFNTSDSTDVQIVLRSKLLRSESVVVSAGKRVQAVQDVPVSVSMVSAADIQERNITRLDDALRYVPGVNLTRDQVNIRGSSGFSLGLGSRVAFLLDGFPILAGDGGDVKFDALPVFSAQRIEVIKGAGSALYGSSALGGVVNMLTTEPTEEPSFSLRTYAGAHTLPRYDMWKYRETMPFLAGADAGFSMALGDVSFLVNGGYKSTEGHTDFQASEQWNIFSKIGYKPSEKLSIMLLLSYAEEVRDNWVYWESLRRALSPGTGTTELFTSRKYFGGLQGTYLLNEKTFLTARSGFYRTDFFTEGTTDGDPVNSAANSWNSELQLASQLTDDIHLTAGANYLLNFITDSPILDVPTDSARQSIFSLYVQGEWKPVAGLTVTLGGRFDGEKSSGLAAEYQFSPKAGISYALSPQTALRASAGVGFRAPTLGERFAALRFGSFIVTPNPQLLYERSVSYEIGGNHSFTLGGERWNIDASFFWNTFDDLIEPRFPSAQNPSIQFQNITKARILGAEISLNATLPSKIADIETSLTILDPRDNTLNQDLKYRTPLMWYSRLAVPVGDFQLQAEYRYLARVENIDSEIAAIITDADQRVAIHLVDARLSYTMLNTFALPLRLSIVARNLLDYYYVEVIGNLAPTRSLLLQADFRI